MKARTAADYARREGHQSVKCRIHDIAHKHGLKFVDGDPAGRPVYARLDHGRWIADCECHGAEAVDPHDNIFFCCSCGNKSTGGRPRAVIFPVEWKIIENVFMSKKDPHLQNWKSGEEVK